LVAAGSGSRMGGATGDRSKTLLPLFDGRSSLELACRAFVDTGILRGAVVAIPAGATPEFHSALADLAPQDLIQFVDGGASRQESVYFALRALRAAFPTIAESDPVLIHDGARPFISTAEICSVHDAVVKNGAALLATPTSSTLKNVSAEGVVESTVPRSHIWQAQTPQGFRFGEILAAHQRARQEGWSATDDCEIAELAGLRVRAIPGSAMNMKMTTPDDVTLARAIYTVMTSPS
ncbi:MAG: 2-C-methyl-D-erythritol 4-phosphate cytidylyltransferase, partial [Deltaproteobacteria bacterium]|nr:2-C-methyl-D-erythritol 4-phosphate cytidylyltransferase [Deltaproteobacteria bacterium]